MTSRSSTLEQDLAKLLARPELAWSIGRQGAIAEFTRTPDEAATIEGCSVITAGGGLSLRTDTRARILAWEELGARRGDWLQRIALCLPIDHPDLGLDTPRQAVTEVGVDTDALRPADRGAILFDLGVGGRFVTVAVRTSDPALHSLLRGQSGTKLLENGDLIHALVAASPHRVFLSALGRLEVYQPIAPVGGDAPEGPHTHLLPDLLSEPERPNSAISPEWVQCAVGYPAHPLRDALGRPRAFHRGSHERFQSLLARYGDPRYLGLKEDLRKAVRAGSAPMDFPVHAEQRTATLVALRQLGHTDGDSQTLERWRAAFEVAPVD